MRDPVVNIPKPVLPAPNAFDFYVAAGNAVTFEDSMKPGVVYSWAQKEAFIQPDAGVIDTLHQGFEHPYLEPSCRSFGMVVPYVTGFRKMARLLALRGQLQAAKQDWGGAVDNYLDALRLGMDIPHGATLTGAVSGITCQQTGRRPMWDAVEHLNAAQSHAAIDRLTRILERRLPFADTIQEEKWLGQAGRLAIFRDARQSSYFVIPVDVLENDPLYSRASSLGGLLYLVYSKSRIMHDFTAYMDRSAQIARQPYGLHLPGPAEPTDPINRALLSVSASARWKDVECETQNELLLVTLALHTFHLENGRYPATLAELAPAYLKKLPDDSYGIQSTFQYHIQGKSYILYSVGPDGKDDGGTPIDVPRYSTDASPRARYRVEIESRGDIVAGINYF